MREKMKPTLTSLYIFQGTIQLQSALHVGGGTVNTTNTDSTVVRTPDGTPYIPGSSFKGVFRSTVEKLAACLPKEHVWTCALEDGKDCFHGKLLKKLKGGESRYDQLKKAAKDDEAKLLESVFSELCDTCRLFGNGFSASRIFFSDLYLKPDAWAGVTQIRDGVVIDRDSERAVEGLKYDFEVVPSGATFEFEIRLENPREPEDIGLTCLGLNEFQSGLGYLGGNRSRGLGKCKMELQKVYKTNFKEIEQLKKYLLNTKLEHKMTPVSDIPGFINESIEKIIG